MPQKIGDLLGGFPSMLRLGAGKIAYVFFVI